MLKEKEKKTLNPGIRALFIYPMNALANDQLKNIRKILMNYEDITFGVYNGATEDKEDDAIKVYKSMFANETIEKLREPLKNELLSREQMKETPPHILFTNYAMLEHLLLRPKDDVLFSESNFKFVVLDEAHVYTGATGIETSILLRRLQARIRTSSKTQFILTSATLGSSSDSDNDIITFATNLCGVNFKKDNIIRSEREEYIPSEGKDYSFSLIRELADEQNRVSDVLDKYNIKHENLSERELIYDFLESSKQYHDFRKSIKKVSSFGKVARILNASEEDCIAFISLCSRAYKNGKALIDSRYHFFLRSLEGCFLTLSKDKKLFLNRRKQYKDNDEDYCVFEVAICDDCGKFALVGSIQDNHLVQVSKIEEKVDFYYLKEDSNNEIEDEEEIEENTVSNEDEVYLLCPHCGAIKEKNSLNNKPCDCDPSDYIEIIRAKRPNNDTSTNLPKCCNCHRGYYNRFYLGNDVSTSVLASALYEELPEVSYEENEKHEESRVSFKKNIFISAESKNIKKSHKSYRQFLVFSDSRQEAAKFACYLGNSYNEFLRRRGICHIIKEKQNEIIQNRYTISDFVKILTTYFCSTGSFKKSNSDESNLTEKSRENAWVAMLNELARTNSSTSLTSLGVLQFEYLGNNDEIINNVVDNYNVDYESAKNLLNLLVFEIVNAGAICPDSDTDIDDDDREYIFYSPKQKFIRKSKDSTNKKTTISYWLPRSKNGKTDEYYKTKRLYYVMEFLHVSQKEAKDLLDQYFDYLVNPGNKYHMIDKNNDGNYVMPAKYFRVRIYKDPEVKWYKCKKCGKISPFNIHGHCMTMKCNSKVFPIESSALRENNHYARLYFSERMDPLFIKEHTAQLSKHESAEYQEQFIKKDINALSCSTTFEMGVDVGDLETVFLRDVPPLPSNYAQRAGRAGRSINAAAYCLTYAKLSSHDLSFFKEPEKMINGIILPPLFKVDNEKIVRRHIYAVAFSMFFADHPEQYNCNDASKFINDKGYKEFIDWLNTKPIKLKDMLQRSIPDIDNLHKRIGIDDFSWLDEFVGENGTFTVLLRAYENNISEFEKLIERYKNDPAKALKCVNKKKNYMNNQLIDFLARGNVLPRYGFPVDTVELEQNTTASNIKKLRLSRDLSVAIGEYAPSSEVVADGKLYTSRYIKKTNAANNKKEWDTAYIGICSNEECKATNYSVTPIPDEGVKCSCCGELLYDMDFYESIEPTSGFVSERKAKKVPLAKQVKNYRTEDVYIGNKESKTIEKHLFRFNGIEVEIESTTNDSLMVRSYHSFYVCNKCGYAIAEDETIPNDNEANKAMKNKALKIKTKNKHESLFGEYDCDCQELTRYSLHHVFNTDVAKLNFSCDTSDYKTMISTMYAILYAITDYLNIERRDIKACLSPKVINHRLKYSIIIYDNVPGGAGHSRRLVTNDGKLLQKIIEVALNNMESCNCNPSCYNCLRSYENQRIHEDLDRTLAIDFLSKLNGDVEVVNNEEEKDEDINSSNDMTF